MHKGMSLLSFHQFFFATAQLSRPVAIQEILPNLGAIYRVGEISGATDS